LTRPSARPLSLVAPERERRAPRGAASALRAVSLLVTLGLAACSRVPAPQSASDLPGGEVSRLRQQMAEVLVQQRDFDLALPYLKNLLALAPSNARLHLLLGIVLREKGQLEAGERELRAALELDPRSPAVHAALGVLLSKRRRFAEAEQSQRRAIALAPTRANYHNDLGFCLFLQKRFEDARKELVEAIRLDPALRAAFNNLGFVHGMLDDREEAMRAFLQGGSRAMALTNMGFLEELKGRVGAARRYYEEALRVKRGYPPALRNLKNLEPGRLDLDGDAAPDARGVTPGAADPTASGPQAGKGRPPAAPGGLTAQAPDELLEGDVR